MTAKTRPKAGILRQILKVICCRKDPAEEIAPKSLFPAGPVKRKRTLKGNSKSAKFEDQVHQQVFDALQAFEKFRKRKNVGVTGQSQKPDDVR